MKFSVDTNLADKRAPAEPWKLAWIVPFQILGGVLFGAVSVALGAESGPAMDMSGLIVYGAIFGGLYGALVGSAAFMSSFAFASRSALLAAIGGVLGGAAVWFAIYAMAFSVAPGSGLDAETVIAALLSLVACGTVPLVVLRRRSAG